MTSANDRLAFEARLAAKESEERLTGRFVLLALATDTGGRFMPASGARDAYVEGHNKGLDWHAYYDGEARGFCTPLRYVIRQPGDGGRFVEYAGITLDQALRMAAFKFVNEEVNHALD